MTDLNHLFISLLLLVLVSPTLYSSATAHQNEQDTPITRFQRYLRIKTAHPTPDYTSAVNFLTQQAQSIPNLQIKTLSFSSSPNHIKPLLLLTLPGSNPSLPSILFNSHIDSVPAEPDKWIHDPFAATLTPDGKIYARGAQDDKCIGMQYLESLRNIQKDPNFKMPIRTIHVSYVPDEEIGGFDGMMKFVESKEFKDLNIGFMLDEGQTSINDEFRVFYADRAPWNLVIKAKGNPGHGSKLFDNSAMENLMKSVELMTKFREYQFDLVKAGLKMTSEVISVNPVYLKAGTPSPTGFVMNMQPSEAEAGFDVRLPPTADSDMLKRRITEEWAPAIRNMTYEITHKGPLRDYTGRPLVTPTNSSNPWWSVFEQAVIAAGGKLAKPEILASTTDAKYLRQIGIPTFGFSPMKNTPILLHDHNEKKAEAISKNAQIWGRTGYLDFSDISVHWTIWSWVFSSNKVPCDCKNLACNINECTLAPYPITQKGPLKDFTGRPMMTSTNNSNPWWPVFKEAVLATGGKLAKPEILSSTTDARFMRQMGIPTLGFSPMKNTPILLHDHNEYLEASVYLEGIKVYESIMKALSSFEGVTENAISRES